MLAAMQRRRREAPDRAASTSRSTSRSATRSCTARAPLAARASSTSAARRAHVHVPHRGRRGLIKSVHILESAPTTWSFANPPYITVKDKAGERDYRKRIRELLPAVRTSVPFAERFFELAIRGSDGVGRLHRPDHRELVHEARVRQEADRGVLRHRVDLTHVIDTSGAYIPGHGTPTVILFGRNAIRRVSARRSGPSSASAASQASRMTRRKGWCGRRSSTRSTSLAARANGSAVADMPRDQFAKHPWSLSGGGAADCGDLFEARPRATHGIGLSRHRVCRHSSGADDVVLGSSLTACARRRTYAGSSSVRRVHRLDT